MVKETVKLAVNGRAKQVELVHEDNRIYFHFGYWKPLIEEIRKMEGRKFHGYDKRNPRKIWSIPATQRNLFQLDYMRLDRPDPYARFDPPFGEPKTKRNLYAHQREMLAHILKVRTGIWACEMGTGKTLAAIEAIEQAMLGDSRTWFVGPKAPIKAVQREFSKWRGPAEFVDFMTYNRMVKVVKEGSPYTPQILVFDECSALKTPGSQRSQAARYLADQVREEWGDSAMVILMTGTPAPKSPANWWNQCEVACPGFIAEGNIHEFQKRLGIYTEEANITGQKFNKLKTWRDDPAKCNICGDTKDAPQHDPMTAMLAGMDPHQYIPSKNEVSYLYERMAGLVIVKFKRDCLDLPEKRYEIIRVEPTPSMLRAAKLITNTAPRAIDALTLLRELSDGFQYREVPTGNKVSCPNCGGSGEATIYHGEAGEYHEESLGPCSPCKGTGEIDEVRREAKFVDTPKDAALLELLEQHDEVGRIVVFGSFTGTIDRLTDIIGKQGWLVIRLDGRGWRVGDGTITADPLDIFDDKVNYPKVAFVAHPGSGGMGLTLTASPSIVYYSNTFSGEDRTQSEDRIHRPGMDLNRGATIYDLFCLDTDEHVYNNLKAKRELEKLTLGELQRWMQEKPSKSVTS